MMMTRRRRRRRYHEDSTHELGLYKSNKSIHDLPLHLTRYLNHTPTPNHMFLTFFFPFCIVSPPPPPPPFLRLLLFSSHPSSSISITATLLASPTSRKTSITFPSLTPSSCSNFSNSPPTRPSIALTLTTSRSVTKLIAVPPLPARAVRPTR